LIDATAISAALEAAADGWTARMMRREVQPLRGLRGVPNGPLARLIDGFARQNVDLDRDAAELDRLFGSALEDGLVAIALVASRLPSAPDAAWDLGRSWLGRIDDVRSADDLGWLVLGPAALAAGQGSSPLLHLRATQPPVGRRALVAAAMAFLPVPIEGPAAAGLRATLEQRSLAFVAEARTADLAAFASAFFRDEAPQVQKGVRRLLRAWGTADPAGLVVWADTVRGGFPKLLGEDVLRARRRLARTESRENAEL
jgi:hypothetical protein